MDWRKTRKWAVLSVLSVLVLSLLVVLRQAPPSAAAAPTFKMRLQTALPSASSAFKVMEHLAERVRKMSDGRLQIQVLADGAIVATRQIPDAVESGLVEAGWTFAQYFAGKNIAGALFGAPPAGGGSKIGMDQFGHMSWLVIGPGRELHEQFYRDILKMNVVVFPVGFYGPLSVGWFGQPVKSLKDLQGRRYRTGPGLIAETWKKIGVPATFLPGGEIVPAGQKGVLDGAQWGAPWDDVPLGFHQIWKYYHLQGAHFPTSTAEILINKSFWDKLPPDLREIVEVATWAAILENQMRLIQDNGVVMKDLQSKYGVKVVDVPDEVFAAFMKATTEVLEKYAGENPFFKKVQDSQREYAELVRPWWRASLKSFVFLNDSATQK